MNKVPTEKEIQKMLKVLENADPKSATRENAIKAIQSLKSMAGNVIDTVENDLKTGRIKISETGEVILDQKN